MKKISILLAAFTLSLAASAQVYTKQYTAADKKLVRKATKWVNKGKWRNGFTKADPDNSVNTTEFYEQYQRNPEVWKSLFEWLQKTDLLTIPAGKTPIPGTKLVASVEDSENGDLAKRNTESHRANIDFMYVVKGVEGFRRLDHETSTPKTEYKYDVIRYNYVPEKAEVLQSVPGHFNIMFPEDWHIAKVKTPLSDQTLRVIVVKMPFAEADK